MAFLTDPHFHSIVLQVLLAVSAGLPALEKLAALTATKKDDDAVKWLADVLSKILPLIPRLTVRK